MAETRWLDAKQQRAWRSYIDGSIRLSELLERDMREKHGLSISEYEILVRLSEAPQRRLRMAELAANATQSRSRLSHAISRLEADGLVRRESCPSDRRGIFAILTDAGMAKLVAAAPDHVTLVRDLLIDVVGCDDLEAIGRAFHVVGERTRTEI